MTARPSVRLGDTKTGKSLRPLGAAALAILKSINRQGSAVFVFPADRGEGYFQGTRGVWAKALERANLPGVTPDTLRHTMGSTAVSTGEALSLTDAILGHANPRSTALHQRR
jgi:integrase